MSAVQDLVARARWHLELAYLTPDEEAQEHAYDDFDDFDDFDDPEDGVCFDCGRWRNGSLTRSCTKAGSEECDFECPYRASLRF